ncbi:MAG: hypothetical protein AB8E74_09800 [Prochlorococcus sp.]
MLATGIPAVAGGLKSAIRLGLDQLGLPDNLIGLFLLNADWLYKEQKILSLLGIALLVVFVVFADLKRLVFKPLRIVGASFLLLISGFSAGLVGRSYLAQRVMLYRRRRFRLPTTCLIKNNHSIFSGSKKRL